MKVIRRLPGTEPTLILSFEIRAGPISLLLPALPVGIPLRHFSHEVREKNRDDAADDSQNFRDGFGVVARTWLQFTFLIQVTSESAVGPGPQAGLVTGAL
jgi:hypothetical protein